MTAVFCKYDDTGRILFHAEVPKSMLELQGDNVHVGRADPAQHYIKHGELTRRPQSPARLNQCTLFNLATPCTIIINGVRYDCQDSEAFLDLSHTGHYAIVVECWPYLDAYFEITKSEVNTSQEAP